MKAKSYLTFFQILFILFAGMISNAICLTQASDDENAYQVDYRFQPPNWQTAICLPDDWQKTLVQKDGTLLYDFHHRGGFLTKIRFDLNEKMEWIRQELLDARTPIVKTYLKYEPVAITEIAFAVAPSLAGKQQDYESPRNDILIIHMHNQGKQTISLSPRLIVDGTTPIQNDQFLKHVRFGDNMKLILTHAIQRIDAKEKQTVIELNPWQLKPGEEGSMAVGIAKGEVQFEVPSDEREAAYLLARAEQFWKEVDLPYEAIQVPDKMIQAQLDSAIRNIYQAREIKNGLPAFQVGPTVYRGLWVVDGSFLMEAVALLGRVDEARAGLHYLLNFQREDGAFMLIDGHWKETGIVLWAVTRHARLTNDPEWLRSVWPQLEKGWEYIRTMRQETKQDASAPNAGLIPVGFSDGGLGGKYPEYTNVYWTLAGMRAAMEAAQWLGKTDEAQAWQKEYNNFYQTFRRAAERDMKTDAQGNRYLPIRMVDDQNVAPQKAQWGFLHAVFPGKVFERDNPLVQGNMAMLRAVEREGLVYGTGWISDGIWNYFASFYAHAWLWLGQGQKAAQILYAFANHASPLLAWREEQLPQGEGTREVGDMPHNWASAEFIRLVRHLLVLERGDELHFLEGMPRAWVQAGGETRLRDVLTTFGPVSLELSVSEDGASAELTIKPPTRNPPQKIMVHLEGWSKEGGSREFARGEMIHCTVSLK